MKQLDITFLERKWSSPIRHVTWAVLVTILVVHHHRWCYDPTRASPNLKQQYQQYGIADHGRDAGASLSNIVRYVMRADPLSPQPEVVPEPAHPAASLRVGAPTSSILLTASLGEPVKHFPIVTGPATRWFAKSGLKVVVTSTLALSTQFQTSCGCSKICLTSISLTRSSKSVVVVPQFAWLHINYQLLGLAVNQPSLFPETQPHSRHMPFRTAQGFGIGFRLWENTGPWLKLMQIFCLIYVKLFLLVGRYWFSFLQKHAAVTTSFSAQKIYIP